MGGLDATFTELGIASRVYLRNCTGEPLSGIPAEDIVLVHPDLCICAGGNIADAATDAQGSTTFSGRIRGGGCVESLDVVADGVCIGTIPIRTNAFDHVPASPCQVDMSDLVALAARLGRPEHIRDRAPPPAGCKPRSSPSRLGALTRYPGARLSFLAPLEIL